MEHFKQNLTGGLRRFAMAGVGAITLTVDKSREIIDQLASRGEVTAAEGQAACDELHKKLAEQVSAFTQKLRTDYENLSFEQMLARCRKLTPEQKQRLLEELTKAPEEASEEMSEETPEETSEASPEEASAEMPDEASAFEESVRNSEDSPAAGDATAPDSVSGEEADSSAEA